MKFYFITEKEIINLEKVYSIELTEEDNAGNKDIFIYYSPRLHGGKFRAFSYPAKEANEKWNDMVRITKAVKGYCFKSNYGYCNE